MSIPDPTTLDEQAFFDQYAPNRAQLVPLIISKEDADYYLGALNYVESMARSFQKKLDSYMGDTVAFDKAKKGNVQLDMMTFKYCTSKVILQKSLSQIDLVRKRIEGFPFTESLEIRALDYFCIPFMLGAVFTTYVSFISTLSTFSYFAKEMRDITTQGLTFFFTEFHETVRNMFHCVSFNKIQSETNAPLSPPHETDDIKLTVH